MFPDFIKRLEELLATGKADKAVAAFLQLWDRSYSRPAEQIDVRAGRLSELEEMPDEALAAELAAMRERLQLQPPDTNDA